MEWQLHPWQMRKHTIAMERMGGRIPWEDRRPRLFWRGTNSNCMPSCSIVQVAHGGASWASCLSDYDCNATWNWSNWHNTPRGRLVLLSQFVEDIDARWTGTSQAMDPALWRYFEGHNLTGPPLPLLEQARWRFALNIDGTGNGDRIYWQLLAGAVVLVQESPLVSWLVGDPMNPQDAAMRPFEHYVPVRYDLSDLTARLTWLRANDDEGWRIAQAGRRFAIRHLGYDNVLEYVDRAVRRYATDHLAGT